MSGWTIAVIVLLVIAVGILIELWCGWIVAEIMKRMEGPM